MAGAAPARAPADASGRLLAGARAGDVAVAPARGRTSWRCARPAWHAVEHAAFLVAGAALLVAGGAAVAEPRALAALDDAPLPAARRRAEHRLRRAPRLLGPPPLSRPTPPCPRLGGLSALDDQVTAGAIMWVPGSLAFLGAGGVSSPRGCSPPARACVTRRATAPRASAPASEPFDLLRAAGGRRACCARARDRRGRRR